MSTPSKAAMEDELSNAGWTQVGDFDWKAPNGNTYSGVAYCWQILKGDQFSKSLSAWKTTKTQK